MFIVEEVLKILVILFSAIILHEYAHGWTANKLGDSTAKNAGRLTLNPLKHIDPFGTIILPGILITMRFMGLNTIVFGWAKPVPVNFMRLRNPKRDMMLVAIAGPAMNIVLAVLLSQCLTMSMSLANFRLLVLAILFKNVYTGFTKSLSHVII